MSTRRALALGHIAPGSRTIRVRIAVAVRGGTDEWAACGGSETTDAQARRDVVDCFDPRDPVSVVWVEADVTVEGERTVEGRVPEIMAEDLEIVDGSKRNAGRPLTGTRPALPTPENTRWR